MKRRRVPADEQRVDLDLFVRDGGLVTMRGAGRNLPTLTAGRTARRRGLGFETAARPPARPVRA
jgi:hypothetical protein